MITLKTESPQGTLGGFTSSVYLSVTREGPPPFSFVMEGIFDNIDKNYEIKFLYHSEQGRCWIHSLACSTNRFCFRHFNVTKTWKTADHFKILAEGWET